MVFFPSYKLLEDVKQVYEQEFAADWVTCVCQTPSMNERDREEFLEEFKEQGETTLVGFVLWEGFFQRGSTLWETA